MYYYEAFIIFYLFIISCNQSETSNNKNVDLYADDSCVDHVALWSASDIAKELEIDKRWVFLNYTIDIWDIPPSDPNPGDIVGELKVQSYARIIDQTEDDYLVESPITKVHGWLEKSHVKSIVSKTIKTKKLCD